MLDAVLNACLDARGVSDFTSDFTVRIDGGSYCRPCCYCGGANPGSARGAARAPRIGSRRPYGDQCAGANSTQGTADTNAKRWRLSHGSRGAAAEARKCCCCCCCCCCSGGAESEPAAGSNTSLQLANASAAAATPAPASTRTANTSCSCSSLEAVTTACESDTESGDHQQYERVVRIYSNSPSPL